MQGLWPGRRRGLAAVAFGLLVSAVVVATGAGSVAGAGPTTLALAPTAAVGCAAVGPYRAPEPGSVGVPVGLGLCGSGPIVIATPGAVLDGWDVRGGIVVDAPDVVVRRSRVTGDGSAPYGIRTTERGTVRIEDTTLTGDFPQAGVGGDHWTGERVEITGVSRSGARLGSGARLRNSVVHGWPSGTGGEAYCVELVGGGGTSVEDNRLDRGAGRGGAVLIAPAAGGNRAGDGPVVIRGNVLGGGDYTLRQGPGSAVLTDVRVSGNRFRRDAAVEPVRVPSSFVLTDNTFVDGGLLPGR